MIRIEIEPYSLKEYTIHVTTDEQSCPLSKIEYVNEKHLPTNQTKLVHIFFI